MASRDAVGNAFRSNSRRLALSSGREKEDPVTFPPGRTMLCDQSGGYRIASHDHDDGDCRRCSFGRLGSRRPVGYNNVDLEPDQLRRQRGKAIVPALRPPVLDDDILALHVAEVAKPLAERLQLAPVSGSRGGSQQTDPGNLCHPLRAQRQWPRERRATNKRNELPPSHSITSLAWARSRGGTVSPKALAVFKLITNSNLVGCSTAKSAVLVPLRILST